jgi:hypothetical protein
LPVGRLELKLRGRDQIVVLLEIVYPADPGELEVASG